MPAIDSLAIRQIVDRTFETIGAQNLEAFLALCAQDVEVIDPHYPTPHMKGQTAIREGLSWAFGIMKSMSFKVVKYYPSEDGRGAAVEVATAHILRSGKALNFPQAFFFETRDGLITRLQAYEPYGPGGVVGLFLLANRLIKKIRP